MTSLFTSVLTILNISELGINSAIAFCLYQPVAEHDVSAINALMALMKKLYRAIGLFILVVGLCLIPFLDKLITGSHPADINIYWLYLIYLVNSVVSYLGFAYKQTLFEVNQRGDVNHKISAVAEVCKYVLQIIVLLVFENYYYYALLLPIASFAITVITQAVSRKTYPEIIPQGTVPDKTKKVIRDKVVFLSAHSIAASVTNSVDNIVLSSFLGLVTVGIYGNYSYIRTAINGFIMIGYRALLPAFGNSLYTDSDEKRGELFTQIQLVVNWILIWCSTCLLCLYQPFMTLWVGEDMLLSFPTVIMIVLYFYANSVKQSLSTIYIQAAGLWNKTLPRQILTALSNLILDILLVRRFGVSGVVFASFITAVLIALPMDVVVVYKDVLHKNPAKGILRTLLWFLASVIVCAVTYLACSIVHLEGITGLILKGIVCLIIPNILLFIALFRTDEFKSVWSRCKSIVYERMK